MHQPTIHAFSALADAKKSLRAQQLAYGTKEAHDPAAQRRRAWFSGRVALLARPLLTGRYRRIGLYYPLAREVDTRPLIRALWQDGCQLFLPKVHGKKSAAHLSYHAYSAGTPLTVAAGGIREPQDAEAAALASLDAVVVPGLAFDASGLRLGQGWGCYDRALADYAGLVVGLAYAHQMCARLPAEPHDRRMHAVITPFAVHWARPTA